jgi:hypothetical protein
LLTNKTILCGLAAVLLIAASAGCKKKREFNEETAEATVDNRLAMAEVDEVIKEINTVMMEQYLLRGRISGGSATGSSSICGAKVDTIGVLTGKASITYDGTDCFGRSRTGDVTFQVNGYPLKKWKHPGTTVSISFKKYKAKRSSDSRVVEINGDATMTNLSGNSWFELWYMGQSSVSYALTGDNLQVTFDESHLAIMSINRKMTYSFSGNVTTCRVEGLGSAEGQSQVENWGQGRDGMFYANSISDPLVWNTRCGAIALTGGGSVLKLRERDYEMKGRYGIDEGGNLVTDACPFGWEVTWKRKSKTNSRKFGYY